MGAEPKDEHYEARVTALEENVKNLVRSTDAFITEVNSKIDGITNLVRVIRTDITESAKTDWKSYFGGLAILLVIVGMVGSGYVRDQNRTEIELNEYMQKFNSHDAANGIHWSLRERVLGHEDEIASIRENLSRTKTWQEKHAENAGNNHSRANEKIRSLERKVFGEQ